MRLKKQRKDFLKFDKIAKSLQLLCFSPADASLLMKIIRRGLIEPKNDLDIQRKDPNSPLYSVKSFDALHL